MKEKTYLAWLNNAYGQEEAMARMYAMHAKDASEGLNAFPELKKRLEQQSKIALSHREKIKSCIVRLGYVPNSAKFVLGDIMGAALGFTGDITIDKVIMNNLTDLGMANFEIGAYMTLIAGAETMDDQETKRVCELILEEERAFSDWMAKNTGRIGAEFLARR